MSVPKRTTSHDHLIFETTSDALLITATLNSVGVLVRTRPPIANRILNAIFSFNPFKEATPTAPIRVKIAVKSMERTIRAFLINLNKRYVWDGFLVVESSTHDL